jgi:hypothetical protein
MKLSDQAADYVAVLHVASAKKKARPWLLLVAAGWAVCPFLLRTVILNPEDMIWLQYKVQGIPLPAHGLFTAQQTGVGFVEALMALAVLILVQLVGTTLFYRRAALDIGPAATPPLWPCAALLPGLLGNAAWYGALGYFDLGGCVIGLLPAWITLGGEIIINRLGKNFVYGQGDLAGLHP